MVHAYMVVIASIFSILIVACEKKDPVELMEKTRHPQNYARVSNPAAVPLEKPDLEDEYYDAPKM